jgi:lipoate-protein ligase B
MPRALTIYQLDRVPYRDALEFQRRLVAQYVDGLHDAGTLVLLEHPPVITIGRGGTEENVLVDRDTLGRHGVSLFDTNRGGDVTYHGPGQIVGYPILPLAFHGRDVHKYLRRLESVLIAMLWEYGIKGERKPGLTGVWTERGKIAAIGVAITHWVTYHGFALNVAPNMDHFKLIHPCGIAGCPVISMRELLGDAPPRAEVEERIIAHFCAEFDFTERIERREAVAP